MVYVFSIDIVLEKFTHVLSVSEFDFSKEKNITILSHLEPQENVEQMYADTTNKML